MLEQVWTSEFLWTEIVRTIQTLNNFLYPILQQQFGEEPHECDGLRFLYSE